MQAPSTAMHRELTTAAASLVRIASLAHGWRQLPRSPGAPVMVLPGFMTDDASSVLLRGFLARLGYRTHGWGMGRNQGDVEQLVPRVIDRVVALADREGQPVRLVGWSLGGTLAREAARAIPGQVHKVVTLGTPVVGGPKYTRAAPMYQRRGVDLDVLETQIDELNRQTIGVPVSAIYSRSDGIVAWQACVDPNPRNQVEHSEVDTSHLGLMMNAQAFRAVAHGLA